MNMPMKKTNEIIRLGPMSAIPIRTLVVSAASSGHFDHNINQRRRLSHLPVQTTCLVPERNLPYIDDQVPHGTEATFA